MIDSERRDVDILQHLKGRPQACASIGIPSDLGYADVREFVIEQRGRSERRTLQALTHGLGLRLIEDDGGDRRRIDDLNGCHGRRG